MTGVILLLSGTSTPLGGTRVLFVVCIAGSLQAMRIGKSEIDFPHHLPSPRKSMFLRGGGDSENGRV